MTDARTIQLRRYQLVPGVLPEFVPWFTERLIPARLAHGFRVEFAYPLPDTDEFVWAVSAEGDAAAFAAVEERYLASPERAAAFADQPQRIASMALALVQPVA